MQKYKVCNFKEIKKRKKISIEISEINILIIYSEKKLYAIENKCGHFGVKLNDAEIENDSITCGHHGFKFSLLTGKKINRKWEECDRLKRYTIFKENDDLYINIP